MLATDTKVTVDEVFDRIAELEPRIRALSSRAEEDTRLPDELTDALAEAGLYRLFRPRSRGGLELDPVSGFRAIEKLSCIDSAVGWNVSIANAVEPFGAWLPDDANEEVFGSSDAVMAGAFFPPRRAIPVEGGYRLSGRTTFNSNCHAATWMCGLAHIYDEEEPRLDDGGHPVTLLTFFPMEDAEIVDNWDTLGMRGTGSHDVVVEDLFVPARRAVRFGPLETPSSAYDGPLHHLSVWPSVATEAVPALGIAQAAIDDFLGLATEKTPAYTTTALKERTVVQLRFAKAVAKLEAARAFLHDLFESAWQSAREGRDLGLDDRARLQLACSHAPLAAAESVDLIHSLVGSTGIRNDAPFQRHFRDVHVITQHAYVSENRFTAVGQVAFGLEPDWAFLHI